MTGGFTSSSFEKTLAGKGEGGSGFLSRCVMAYTGDVKHVGNWATLNTKETKAAANKMLKRFSQIDELCGMKRAEQLKQWEVDKQTDPTLERPPLWRFVPKETDDAIKLRTEFQKQLGRRRIELAEDDLGHLTSRLESHFKRDLLLRALFSGLHPEQVSLDEITITAEMVTRSITWATYELYLRGEVWPIDQGAQTERMEQAMRRALKKHHALTKTQLQSACHTHRGGSGGVVTFNLAWAAMLKGDVIVEVGRTSDKVTKFGLSD